MTIISLLLALALLGGCAKEGGSADNKGAARAAEGETVYAVDASGLNRLMSDLQAAIHSNDIQRAASLSKGLLPGISSIKKALAEGETELAASIEAMHKKFAPKDEKMAATLFATSPDRTEILVHAASTEQLLAYEKGSVAYNEFPGGAKEAAAKLRKEKTFYELELLAPGKDKGMKYHLFFHDGSSWKMLGPVWRAR